MNRIHDDQRKTSFDLADEFVNTQLPKAQGFRERLVFEREVLEYYCKKAFIHGYKARDEEAESKGRSMGMDLGQPND